MKMFAESEAGSEMVALCAMCIPMTYYWHNGYDIECSLIIWTISV